MMIVRLDRERALRLARSVASWHRPDDTAGALDCFMGMVRGDFTEEQIADIWRVSFPSRPARLLD
jgi:molybdopterin synthase catalytic subunit